MKNFQKTNVISGQKAPYGSYSLVQQKPGDLKEIYHLGCWDGASGADVDILDGKIFSIVCEAPHKEGSNFLESIVKDNTGKLYTLRYQCVEKEKLKKIASKAQKEKEMALLQHEKMKKARIEENKQLKLSLEASMKKIEHLENQLAEIKKWSDNEINRQRLVKEAAETEKAEKELSLILAQVAAEKKKQEMLAQWDADIEATIKHVQVLLNYNLTYGELVKTLEDIKSNYSNSYKNRGVIEHPRISSVDPSVQRTVTNK